VTDPMATPQFDRRQPFSLDAEQSVVGQCLATPKIVGQVVSTMLEPTHFFNPPMRALYDEIVQRYYGDEEVDALTVAEHVGKTLARSWSVDEAEAVRRVKRLAEGRQGRAPEAIEHAKLVKRHADYRALLELAATIERDVDNEVDSPEQIAGLASQTAMQVATSTLLTQELTSFEDLGRNFVREQKKLMAARAQGVELGAYFGLDFLDSYLRGLRPSELLFVAGEPGAGKSFVTWKAAQMFAERQMRKPQDQRVGTLVLSLEMSETNSSTRIAQSLGRLDGGKLREGRTDDEDLKTVVREWKARQGLPLFFNFSSNMRASQLRALVVEAIRRHNVGLVLIDHFKYVDMDGRWRSDLEQEEAKARFLKQDIATQLNVAVICLAHTTKGIESREDARPKLSHLRGSGQVAAHADFVAFVYRPFNHAKPDAIDAGEVKRTDAEMIYAKSRHGLEGTAEFFFDASTGTIY
jgi:replicative DNA helicase